MKSHILLAIGISLVLALGALSAFSSQHQKSQQAAFQQEMLVAMHEGV